MHVAQITGVITGEGRGRQTKPGSHPYFPFIYPPCSPVSFRGRRSIDRLDSNLREHRFAKVFLPFLRVNGRSIFHRRARHKFDPDHSTFGNEFGKWLEKKRMDLWRFWPDVETLNRKWTSVEFALVWPPIAPPVSYLRIYVRVNT